MATNYTVKQGDHVSKVAKQFGFANFRTIWDHPNNAELKTKRENPNVLAPGDRLYIPDKELKSESAATERVHRFQVSSPTLTLRLVMRNIDDKPLANEPCELQIDGKKYPLTTDGKGKIEQAIPSDAETAELVILNRDFPIKIGHLDPVDQINGYRERLNNLGYNAGSSEDPNDAQLRSAIEEFQCDHHLKVDGTCGKQTQAELKKVHGS